MLNIAWFPSTYMCLATDMAYHHHLLLQDLRYRDDHATGGAGNSGN